MLKGTRNNVIQSSSIYCKNYSKKRMKLVVKSRGCDNFIEILLGMSTLLSLLERDCNVATIPRLFFFFTFHP